MPRFFDSISNNEGASSFQKLWHPLERMLRCAPVLKSRGDRPLQMDFEEQLKALVFFHLEEHKSARQLLQILNEDEFARETIAPEAGIQKSSFSEAINTRGLEQLQYVFQQLQQQAAEILPKAHEHIGNLVAIDGSLINAVLSMHWAEYRDGAKKAKIHLGFDLNRGIPLKLHLTNGKDGERPFVQKILAPGHTGVLDRGYQSHELFDSWENQGIKFVCRILSKTQKTVVQKHAFDAQSFIFYDATVLLGTPGINQTDKNIRLVGYRVNRKDYWLATNRFDLSAEQIASIYKLRWEIENFFAWWKRHLKVYHLIARSEYGLMVQVLSGLITYLLLAIYCHQEHNEKVNIKRVRQLRIKIQNEARNLEHTSTKNEFSNENKCYQKDAKT